MPTTLTIAVPRGFSLAHAVCSYGYFILAPNYWCGGPRATGHMFRPLHDRDGRSVQTCIERGPDRSAIRIRCDRTVDRSSHAYIRGQVARMLRLDEDLRPWKRLHPVARKARFDCVFRSPTLFEDLVKTITTCNVTWPLTMKMNHMLCQHAGEDGAFPTPDQLARWTPKRLAHRCRVGYRAERIIRLARDVKAGRIDLEWFEQPQRGSDELYDALRQIYGIGDYAASNMLQLLGHYDRVPVDSETVRHLREHHSMEGDNAQVVAAARVHYDRYAPFQFLAYWFEHWGDYQSRFGPAHQWEEHMHDSFTASNLK
jgi:3-methyladenine DNA glycosylase/8-oxoguanine DNA glycosylase